MGPTAHRSRSHYGGHCHAVALCSLIGEQSRRYGRPRAVSSRMSCLLGIHSLAWLSQFPTTITLFTTLLKLNKHVCAQGPRFLPGMLCHAMFCNNTPSQPKPLACQIMECLEMHFKWDEWFQPRLHAIVLFFGNAGRCHRFMNVCIKRNDKLQAHRCRRAIVTRVWMRGFARSDCRTSISRTRSCQCSRPRVHS